MARPRGFWRDESGASAVEYVLIAGLVAAVIYAGVAVLGGRVQDLFDNVASAVDSSM